jgi:hypothetical protein
MDIVETGGEYFTAFLQNNLFCEKLQGETIMTALAKKMMEMKSALQSKLLKYTGDSEEQASDEYVPDPAR